MFSVIKKGNGFPAYGREVFLTDILHRVDDDVGCHADLGAEAVFQILDDIKIHSIFHAHSNDDFIGLGGRIGVECDVVVLDITGVAEHIGDGWRVKGGAFVLDHVVLAAHNRTDAEGVAAAAAGLRVDAGHIAGTETQQRHAFHPQGGDNHFSDFSFRNGLVVFTDDFHDNQFRVVVTATGILTFGEGGAHLGGGVSCIEFHIPFRLDLLS